MARLVYATVEGDGCIGIRPSYAAIRNVKYGHRIFSRRNTIVEPVAVLLVYSNRRLDICHRDVRECYVVHRAFTILEYAYIYIYIVVRR